MRSCHGSNVLHSKLLQLNLSAVEFLGNQLLVSTNIHCTMVNLFLNRGPSQHKSGVTVATAAFGHHK